MSQMTPLYRIRWPLPNMPGNCLTWTDRETIAEYLQGRPHHELLKRAREHGFRVTAKATKADVIKALLTKVEYR